jgi:chromosomal replication initiator protein
MSTIIEDRIWNNILQAVEKRLNRQSFDTWIRPIHFEGFDESQHVLHLRAPNHVVKDWVSTNYSDVIDESLAELNLPVERLDWTITEEGADQDNKDNKTLNSLDLEESATTATIIVTS